MKGSLKQTDKGWIVEYADYDFLGQPCVGLILPLYPGDEDYIKTVPNYQNMLDGSKCIVDFEIFEDKDRCQCNCHNSGGRVIHFAACCNGGYITRGRYAILTRS